MGLATDLGYTVTPPSGLHRLMHRIASSRPGAWSLARTLPAMDRATARLTRGRTTAAQVLAGLPVLVVTTTGRRSGRPREAQLLGIPVGEDLAIIGTNFGQASTPTWVLNLEADPHATASYAGRSVEVVARPATGAEREEIVRRGRAIYHGYGSYVGRIHRRRMRVFVLEPAAPGPGAAG